MQSQIEELKKTIMEKDEEIRILKQKLEQYKLVQFDDKNIIKISEQIKPKVQKEKELLYKNNNHSKIKDKTLYHKYQESKLFKISQSIKKIPLVGNLLILIKHHILNWK